MNQPSYDILSYLKQRDPTIRNQLIPIRVDYDEYQEQIIRYFKSIFEQASNLTSDQQLEIEIKLGTFLSKEDKYKEMIDNFRFASKYHHLLITQQCQNYTFQPNFVLYHQDKFDTNSLSSSFINLAQYFRNLEKNDEISQKIYSMYIDPEKNAPSLKQQYGLRLDLLLQNSQRVSIYLNGKKAIIQKKRLENLDIMKDYIQYRLSSNIENNFNIPIDFDNFIDRNKFRSIRFKQYQIIQYQFLEISLSRVLTVDNQNFSQLKDQFKADGQIQWNKLLYHLLFKLYDINPEIKYPTMRDNIINNVRRCEIEFEIHDINFFRQNLTAFARMQRNVDSFFYCDAISADILYSQIQKIHPEADRRKHCSPLIGNYLQTVYRVANKYM
ncbi:unnamed protein product [Paramecium primaurelia]|uniref:Uncharacterized protein n=1 Tax=Paramecium primaurelia TaxID=5886 RepID=A0A8S1LK92_PARPR|nr:unnamed protein product [Paramecium primaurelia]